MEQKRRYSLDVLRVIATFCIVCHHYQQVTGAYWEGKINFYGAEYYFGYLVEFFFLLSGFFMYPYIEKVDRSIHFKEFFLKRFLRLCPLVCISGIAYEVLICIFFRVYGVAFEGQTVNIWALLTNIFGIQQGWVFWESCVNNPMWYVSVLLLCYVIFYILTYMSKRCNIPHIYFYIFMVLLGCGISTYGIGVPFFNGTSCRGFYSFFFGILMAEVFQKWEIKKRDVAISLASIALLTYFIVFQFDWVSNGLNYILTFWYFPAWIVLFSSKYVVKAFDFPFLGVLGKVTYDIYVWHIPTLIFLQSVMGLLRIELDLLENREAMWIYVLLCFVVGILSYYILEEPIHKWISRKMKEYKMRNV